MCGIFGLAVKEGSNFSGPWIQAITRKLFLLSESRGKEASGLAILSAGRIHVHKEPKPVSVMIRSKSYEEFFNRAVGARSGKLAEMNGSAVTIIGHSRLVTNGSQEIYENNQPVVKDGLVGIHNGIIVNVEGLWHQFRELKKAYDVDTETILSLIRLFSNKQRPIIESAQRTFRLIQGAASIGILFRDFPCLLLATNNGSLYICRSRMDDMLLFASEKYILKALMKKGRLKKDFQPSDITQLKAGQGYLLHTSSLEAKAFSLDAEPEDEVSWMKKTENVIIDGGPQDRIRSHRQCGTDTGSRKISLDLKHEFSHFESSVAYLKRCTRCILPETVPFIEFDVEGVCSYCRNHKRTEYLGEDTLRETVERYRRTSGGADCILMLSGGRDSTYGLHYLKTRLNLNPIAFTYDWGMVTDLARRNISRVCGKLGVEHILLSADIRRKRKYIRQNVEAWLKKPQLGMIPLFMAGDKQFMYYIKKVMIQTETPVAISCRNNLEKTFFKTGFCGVREGLGRPYDLPWPKKTQLSLFYLKQYLLNWSYFNRSLFDTIGAFFSSFLTFHWHIRFYDYIPWDEREIVTTLRDAYDWEMAKDTNATWRIGDGTAAFYNYIYYVAAGFTENDTFLSNQIREGMVRREEALKLALEQNKPRFESIQWYCDTIGIDFEKTIKMINSIPKLYHLIEP